MIQKIVRARSVRIALVVCLLATGAWGFAPYVLSDVSTQAAINAPLIRLTAAMGGTVAALPDDGRYFAAPTKIDLLTLSRDTGDVADLRAQAEQAQAQIALGEKQLAEIHEQEALMKRRASVFANATTRRLGQDHEAAEASLGGCRADRAERLASFVRARKLAAIGFMSPAGVEKAQAAVLVKDGDCLADAARSRSLQTIRLAARSGVFLGDGYNDAPYAVQQADRLMLQRQGIERTLADARAQYAQATRRLQDVQARASYAAPAGTLVWSIMSSPGAAIRVGDPILDLLDCRRRFVQVALPENKAEVIGPGDPADIRLIGSDRWLKGKVVNITGAAGRRREDLLAATTYSLPGGREIMVDVALPAPLPNELNASRKCDVGRLAEVRFSRGL